MKSIMGFVGICSLLTSINLCAAALPKPPLLYCPEAFSHTSFYEAPYKKPFALKVQLLQLLDHIILGLRKADLELPLEETITFLLTQQQKAATSSTEEELVLLAISCIPDDIADEAAHKTMRKTFNASTNAKQNFLSHVLTALNQIANPAHDDEDDGLGGDEIKGA